MANEVIYPPIVDSAMPAFLSTAEEVKIYFRLSKLSNSQLQEYKYIHCAIRLQKNNLNVVNKEDSGDRLRRTGIILNLLFESTEEDSSLFFVRLKKEDIKGGWQPGDIYKIQLRLSKTYCSTPDSQANWLSLNARDFSEWSTVCVVKAIKQIFYDIPVFYIEESTIEDDVIIQGSTLEIFGRFYDDKVYKIMTGSEYIYSYRFKLYNNLQELIEDSGVILANKYQDNASFNYVCKTEMQNSKSYTLEFEYTTRNDYSETALINFTNNQYTIDKLPYVIYTAETEVSDPSDPDGGTYFPLEELTTVSLEEDEGRLGIKLYDKDDNTYTGNICIRRTDSRSNFQLWEDIKILVLKKQRINDLDIFYDYTVESGVWYKYGIQKIEKSEKGTITRGVLTQSNPILRNFDYSFLLGENEQQLKLMFDFNMNSYNVKKSDSVNETIGGRTPIITRNGNLGYKTFPINGVISFWSDENDLFCTKRKLYKYPDIVNLYNEYNTDNGIIQYDYIHERNFREAVIEFLQDAKPKLFKSPTEGNVIVRLTDVGFSPNQTLGRLVYTFSCTAYEIADNTMENYLKYDFYNVGECETEFNLNEVRIGQIQSTDGFSTSTNIFEEIGKKYNIDTNVNGYTYQVGKISNLKITFDGNPLRILNKTEYALGNKFDIGASAPFIVLNPIREYSFDESLTYSTTDTLYLLGDAEGTVTKIPATIDFTYELVSVKYKEKRVKTRTVESNIGQLFEVYESDTNIYDMIKNKYYLDLDFKDEFRYLAAINSVEIEAEPNAVFSIRDEVDTASHQHQIGVTETLNFSDLSPLTSIVYNGIKQEDGTIDTRNAGMLITYQYDMVYGTYETE